MRCFTYQLPLKATLGLTGIWHLLQPWDSDWCTKKNEPKQLKWSCDLVVWRSLKLYFCIYRSWKFIFRKQIWKANCTCDAVLPAISQFLKIKWLFYGFLLHFKKISSKQKLFSNVVLNFSSMICLLVILAFKMCWGR